MKCDIVLAGVGGQGVLSIASAIASSALRERLFVKQSEVHGMAQRGGAVMANLRLADHEIASDLISQGSAHLIVAMEPLESLRYVSYLSHNGVLITSANPVLNIDNYPDLSGLLEKIRSLPRAIILDAELLARNAGSTRATNMVMVGAAMSLLPVHPKSIEDSVTKIFARKGDRVVSVNLRALEAGREAAESSAHSAKPRP
jgi:indolepyruvate ferredoxin oxidoreductase, beta subunit